MLDPAGPRTAFWGFGNAWVRGAIDDGGAFYRSVSYEGVGGLISIGLDWGLARWRRTEVRLFFFFFFLARGVGRRLRESVGQCLRAVLMLAGWGSVGLSSRSLRCCGLAVSPSSPPCPALPKAALFR